MKFRQTPLAGVLVVEIEPQWDTRGFFARLWCEREFALAGLPTRFVQASLSRNPKRGTVRGMHMQLPPSAEGKLVRCTRGCAYDVVVDLRPVSPTYLRHFAAELSAERHEAVYVPPGLLHGFQTLENDTDLLYEMTDFHAPELAFGARWNDPALGVDWPIRSELTIADRDASYPDFDRAAFERLLAAAALRGSNSEA